MVTDPDEVVVIDPPTCADCGESLADAPVFATRRQQVLDAPPPPPRPHVTEYRVLARTCPCCGKTTASASPPGVTGR
ncbi:IS66 family transposase zinc-finger binding domain-containing protein, partial [Frankia sp. CiP3]